MQVFFRELPKILGLVFALVFVNVNVFAARSLFDRAPISFSAPEGIQSLDRPALVSLNLEVILNARPGDKVLAVLDNVSTVILTLTKKRKKDGKLVWNARVDASSGKGKAFFFVKKGTLFGYIKVNGKKYEIAPFGGTGYYAIQNKDHLNTPRFLGDTLSPSVPSNGYDSPSVAYSSASSSGTTTIDLMMLYTSELAAAYKGNQLDTRLDYIVEVANQAYIDSHIDLRLRIVKKMEVNYNNDNEIDTALRDLTNARGVFASVPQLRNQYGADLVTLVRKYKKTKKYCGLAWLLRNTNPSASQGYGYSVVEDGSDSGWYCADHTLAHELGHNMGCAHDSDHANSQGIFSYSYGYDKPNKFATIMSYDHPHIEYFSNPSIKYDGDAIGDPNNADNARTIRETKDVVAAFRAEVNPTYDGPWLSGTANIGSNWSTVNFGQTIEGAVVIAGPPTTNDSSPGVIRVRNVDSDSFEMRFQEWMYEDDSHGQEKSDYLIIPLGRHEQPDGTIWEVQSFDVEGTGQWISRSFSKNMPSVPALFCTVQTFNGADPVAVRVKNVTESGFEVAMFEEEAKMDGHTNEKVGCLAVYSPSLSGSETVDGSEKTFLMQVASVGPDFVPVLSSDIAIQEEKSKDSETWHVDETVNVLAIGNKILAQDVGFVGADTISLRILKPEYSGDIEWGSVSGVDHNWVTVPLAKVYSNPVVVVKPASYNGPNPGIVRISGVQGTSFNIRFNEWAYEDGIHTQERVFYLVADSGLQTVGGMKFLAGKTSTSKLLKEGWTDVGFSSSFDNVPAIFASVQSFVGADPVTVRIKNRSKNGFSIAMDEEEAKRDGHITETLGWIAVEKGSGVTSDYRKIKVFDGSLDHNPKNFGFGESIDRRFPVAVAEIDSTVGEDTCSLRYKNITQSAVELFIEEETSKDSEVAHISETISVFAAE